MKQPSIVVRNVCKRYRIGHGIPSLRDLFSRNGSKSQYHWALRDLSFDLKPGEALGIIGPNGSGKTTTLKLLSYVTRPTGGEIMMNGRFSALIELGAGFHPDLTGRENVFLNGTILGMSREQIKERFDDIIEFAGIGNYLDTPVKRYSSGMYARLGFSIAAHVDPDILLVDEVLAVGDYNFQQKCYARMDQLRAQGTTLIFVSHNMDVVRRVCDRGLVLYRGECVFQGGAVEAVIAYSDAIREAARNAKAVIPEENGKAQQVMSFDAEVVNVKLLNETDTPVTVLCSGTVAKTVVDVDFHRDVQSPIFSFFIRTADGRTIYVTTTRWRKIETPDFSAGDRCRVEFSFEVPLLDGEYILGVDVGAATHYHDRVERALSFLVVGSEGVSGLVDLKANVSFEKYTLEKEHSD
jgi:ABC-type polysaccharide/polyol phosphate transport system ATPase subunit